MHTLRTRILALVSSLVLVTTLTMLATFWVNTSKYTRGQVNSDIATATRLFKEQLASREMQLVNSAELLTSDFGFKQAVATHDTATIKSALANHSHRVQADLMFLTGLAGRVTASTQPSTVAEGSSPFPRLIRDASRRGGALGAVRLGNQLYQLVIVPVRAPMPIAFAGIGFRLDQGVAERLKALSGLDVSFVAGDAGTIATTLSPTSIETALAAPNAISPWFGVPLVQSSQFVTRRLDIQGNAGQLVLTASLGPAASQFARLRNEILLLTLVVLAMAIIGSIVLSENISRPLNKLVSAALEMAKGDFNQRIDTGNGTREVSTLFSAFNTMGHDIQAREAKITWQAQHDGTTDLLTRNALIEAVDKQLDEGAPAFAMVILSVPGVGRISDSFGPAFADKYLKAMADRLTAFLDDTSCCARVGTGEFAYIQPAERDPEESVLLLANQLQTPLALGDLTVKPEIVLGYVRYPSQGDTATDLYRRASIALDRARDERVLARQYHNGEDETQRFHLKLTNDLKDAIAADDGQLFMVYQPKLNLSSGKVEKVEALIRWEHPEEGFISPELFVSLAEESNLVTRLTDWVIHSVIRQCNHWYRVYPDLQVAINVSSQDLERPGLLSQVRHLLKVHSLPHHVVAFEMTERDMMNDPDRAVVLMSRFKEAGFDLSVDDYGIGYSSLSKLKQMPVSEIKIDKHFITHLADSESDQIIVRSTIDLGHSFGLRVIAEGVENQASQALLESWGCDYIQGYHLGRPMAPDDFAEWMNRFNERRVVIRL